MGKKSILKKKKIFKIIHFFHVKTGPRLQYCTTSFRLAPSHIGATCVKIYHLVIDWFLLLGIKPTP
jgi:hypothetical protein